MTDQAFKNYTIDREVGKGGMATIYLAKDERTGRPVALKFLLPHIATNENFVRLFMEEFKANEFLKHQNIVEAIEAGQHDGRWYMAMEYLDGGSLKELIRDRGRLPLDLAVHVIMNVLKGLQYSHHCGVVHQDMKPANLMVQKDGAVKIADFGISKVASPAIWKATGRIRGTPAYMAPEQAAGKEPTYRWDIFSSGVVFYELLAGFNPFGAKDPQDALKKILGENPPALLRAAPTMPHDIELVVWRMLEKDPEKRYSNIEGILIDLQRITQKLQLAYSQALFRDWIQDPDRIGKQVVAQRHRFHLESARRILQGGRAMADLALWHVYLAALCLPEDADTRMYLNQVARDYGFSLQRSNSMGLQSAEAKLTENPDDVKLQLQLAKLHRADGNALQTFYFGRLALSTAPLDQGVRQQVDKALGPGKLDYL